MARISTKDPLDRFRWIVECDRFTRAGFSTCDTPSVSINTRSYPEGGAHLHPKKIVDSISYKPITLTRGVTESPNFYQWVKLYFDLIMGRRVTYEGDAIPLVGATAIDKRTVKIHHVNRQGETRKTYILYGAFPIEFKPASDFDAAADDAVSMETIVLDYESFDVINYETPEPSFFDPNNILKGIIKKL